MNADQLEQVLGHGLASLLVVIGLWYCGRHLARTVRQGRTGASEAQAPALGARRRIVGAGLMVGLGVLMNYGVWLTPPDTREAKRAWGIVWLVVTALALLLLLLGLWDWLALRMQYRHQRDVLAAERRVTLELEMRKRHKPGGQTDSGTNGSAPRR